MKINPNLKTENCLLRLPKLEDAEEMLAFALANQKYLSPFEPTPTADHFAIEYWQQRIRTINEDYINGRSCCFNIYHDNILIGMVNFTNIIRGCFHSCFLGLKIAQHMQGKGLMTQCLQAAIEFSFKEMNLHRISANYMTHNTASAKVLAKCGFEIEGTAKDYLYINGKWEDHVLTSLVNRNWRFGQ